MGNRLCKKKNGDIVDSPKAKDNTFDRIITRLHLRPNSWKSESQLSKQVNRSTKSKSGQNSKLETSKPLSRSTDWLEASLEVPEKDSPIELRNPKLALIFNHEDHGTPTPPPRKHKKGIREKIEAVAKSGLQALQSKKPVDEPLCIKKTINYDCPCHRIKHKHNQRDHNIEEKNIINREQGKLESSKKIEMKESKRKKNLSVVSLPNYSELKFSVADFGDIDRKPSDDKSIKSSHISLPGEAKKAGRSYMIRCRSFGSLLPQQLLDRLKPATNKVTEIESDDSFGPLEDWDLGLIEHYNPRDASLPRPRKSPPKSDDKMLSDLESLIITEDPVPTPPVRRSESILRQKASDLEAKKDSQETSSSEAVEHSSLMRILQEFSMKDRQNEDDEKKLIETETNNKPDGISPVVRVVNDFINAEKTKTSNELSMTNVKETKS